MMYVSQIIMLYTLNLYGAVCQLCLHKTGRIKKTYLMAKKEENGERANYVSIDK